MERGAVRVLLGTGALLVLATLWVPVAPRDWERVLAVIDRADGTRRLVTVDAATPRVERDWIWRTFARAAAPDPDRPDAGVEVGDLVAREKPALRRRDAGVHLVMLVVIGGLLAFALDLRARKRLAQLAEMAAALPVEEGGVTPASESRGGLTSPGRIHYRIVIPVGACIAFVVAALVALSGRMPATVERWVTLVDIALDRSFGPPPSVAIRFGPTPSVWPPDRRRVDVAVESDLGPRERRELQSQVREAFAARFPQVRHADLHPEADAATPFGRVADAIDALHDPALGIRWKVDFSSPEGDSRAGPAASDRGGAEPMALPRAGHPARYVADRAESFDVHVSRDGSIRVRAPDAGLGAGPVSIDLEGLEARLKSNARRARDRLNPQYSVAPVLIHADARASWSHVERCILPCLRFGYVNLAFVVEPRGP